MQLVWPDTKFCMSIDLLKVIRVNMSHITVFMESAQFQVGIDGNVIWDEEHEQGIIHVNYLINGAVVTSVPTFTFCFYHLEVKSKGREEKNPKPLFFLIAPCWV